MRKVTQQIKQAFERGEAKKRLLGPPRQTARPFGYMATQLSSVTLTAWLDGRLQDGTLQPHANASTA